MTSIQQVTIEEIVFVGNDEYCKPDEVQALREAETLNDLRYFGKTIIGRMLRATGRPITQVCGPMSTGGGTMKENYDRVSRAIVLLRDRDRMVFSQLPFYHGIIRFIASPKFQGPEQIIEDLYVPLFGPNGIENLAFLRGWEASIGAGLEHRHGKRLGIGIEYLPSRY